jgi:Ca2+-binding RTX toxin-like protein
MRRLLVALTLTAFLSVPAVALADVVTGTDAGETLVGTLRDDRIFGLSGTDSLIGAAGNDYLDGGRGADTLRGDGGNDRLTGEVCNNQRCDAPESDILIGGFGDDYIESNTCRPAAAGRPSARWATPTTACSVRAATTCSCSRPPAGRCCAGGRGATG